MAIASVADYVASNEAALHIPIVKTGMNPRSRFGASFYYPAIPTTAAALSNTDVGCLNYGTQVGESGTNWAVSGYHGCCVNLPHTLLLADRLSHQGGLSANTSSAQTTNLPTAALTRYTDGVGVMARLEVYAIVGPLANTTATLSYTNQAGTSGRTSKAVDFATSTLTAADQQQWVPLQDGDTGVRSVESVTLNQATGVVGNFGVTLFKPIGMYYSINQTTGSVGPSNEWDAMLYSGCHLPLILPGAYLELIPVGTTAALTIYGQMSFIRV